MNESTKTRVGRPPIHHNVYEQAAGLDVGQKMQIKVPAGKHPSAWRKSMMGGLRSWLATRNMSHRYTSMTGQRVVWITREE